MPDATAPPAATAAVALTDPVGLDEWRSAARALLVADVAPEAVTWTIGSETDLFATAGVMLPPRTAPPREQPVATVPRRFLALADAVLAHRDTRRHALLYRLLWRIAKGARSLLDDATDDDVLLARGWAKAVQRDVHKMKAFLRFREVPGSDGDPPAWVAWFEPEQRIVERAAPFFVRRFASMRWSILTPDRSAYWDGEQLLFGAGAARHQAPAGDGLDDLWRDYYASTFNPARLKVAAMTREMPKRYWKNLPEARLIPGLVRDAAARSEGMIASGPATPRRRNAAAARGKPGPASAPSADAEVAPGRRRVVPKES